MKKTLASLLLIMVSFNASAATLECRLLGVNDSPDDVKSVFVETTKAAKEIGTLGGEKVSVSELNGYFEIRSSGSLEISAGSKSGDMYLSIEGQSVECTRIK